MEFNFDDDLFQSKCADGGNGVADHHQCLQGDSKRTADCGVPNSNPESQRRFDAKREFPGWFYDKLLNEKLNLSSDDPNDLADFCSKDPENRDLLRLAGNYHYFRRNFGEALKFYRLVNGLINPVKERTLRLEIQEAIVRCCIHLGEDWKLGFRELMIYIHDGWNVDHEIVACSLVNDFVKSFDLMGKFGELNDLKGRKFEDNFKISLDDSSFSMTLDQAVGLSVYRCTALARLIGYSDKNPDIWIDFGDSLRDLSLIFATDDVCSTARRVYSNIISNFFTFLKINEQCLRSTLMNCRDIVSEIDSACRYILDSNPSTIFSKLAYSPSICCWLRARTILETHLNDPGVSDWISSIYRNKLLKLNETTNLDEALNHSSCEQYDRSVVMERMTGDLRFRERLAEDVSAVSEASAGPGSNPPDTFTYRSDESSTEKLGGNPGLIFKLKWRESIEKCFKRWFDV